MRFSAGILLCALLALLAGCGGGGGGDGSASAGDTIAAPANPVPNVMVVTVELGPSRNVNLPFTSVTVCAPGSDTNCRTIDHVLVDTGSNGLRLFASALAGLDLPQQRSGGAALAECLPFADGTSVWGPVRLADARLAGHRVSSLPVHVVGDAGFAAIPDGCSSSLSPTATPQEFGANGILGVGDRAQDCGELCSANTQNGYYYVCSSACSPSAAALGLQVPNPVSRFASDNNGVVLKMPAVPTNGAATVSGSLIFGIGTQANNALGAAQIFQPDPATGYFTTVYRNRQYTKSFIDSGSNAIKFDDAAINVCDGYDHGFYCPPSTLNLSATMVGDDGVRNAVAFSVANADALFAPPNSSYVAFGNLAGPAAGIDNTTSDGWWSPYFDWGLPFFYGRSVFTAIRDRYTPGGKGPYYAY